MDLLIEQRTYVLHVGASLEEYLETYEHVGLPAQRRILGGFLGYFVSDIGMLNELTHMWAYSDLEDRRTRRATLAENSDWQACLQVIRPMIQTMSNKIMYPTSFSPIRSLPVTGADPLSAFDPQAPGPALSQ